MNRQPFDNARPEKMDKVASKSPFPERHPVNAECVHLANIRHELCTPINAIIGYSEIMTEDADAHGLVDLGADLRKIHISGRRLMKLVSQLFDDETVAAAQPIRISDLFGGRARHELRTPLNVILGYSEMLAEDLRGDDRKNWAVDLRRIHESAQRLLLLIDQAGPALASTMENTDRLGLMQDAMAAIPAPGKAASSQTSAHRESLLLVDDNPMNLDLMARQLRREGYNLAMAENGRGALEMLGNQSFDLILLDVMMPGLNGFQVLQGLKQDDALKHIPVIMVSALDELDSVVRCIEIGAEDYLQKPVDPILLKTKINSILEKKHLRDREQAYLYRLSIEQEKSENLLLNILPKPIIDRLKNGETNIADIFPEVTVLFADLIGFSNLAARLSPGELIGYINDIFSDFDRLVVHHGLEKIKTIGDAYMVASGVPLPRADHAEAMAAMALDMLHAIKRFNGHDSAETFHIRIGIHTGSVIAGIVGTKKFVYDLWGDTVNIASRLESSSPADTIQVSEAAYALLRDTYDFKNRGLISVKGKENINTYFLHGKKARTPPSRQD